jgi:hypothetical protein
MRTDSGHQRITSDMWLHRRDQRRHFRHRDTIGHEAMTYIKLLMSIPCTRLLQLTMVRAPWTSLYTQLPPPHRPVVCPSDLANVLQSCLPRISRQPLNSAPRPLSSLHKSFGVLELASSVCDEALVPAGLTETKAAEGGVSARRF